MRTYSRNYRATIESFKELSEEAQLELIALRGAEKTRWDVFHDEMKALGMSDSLLQTMPHNGWPSNYPVYWKTNLV